MVFSHFKPCESLANHSSVHHSNVDIYTPINSLLRYSNLYNSLSTTRTLGKSF